MAPEDGDPLLYSVTPTMSGRVAPTSRDQPSAPCWLITSSTTLHVHSIDGYNIFHHIDSGNSVLYNGTDNIFRDNSNMWRC